MSINQQTTAMEDIQGSTIDIAGSGDLRLVVGPKDKQITFLVFSSSVRLASPVLNSMFDPGSRFMEGHSLDREFTFPEDDVSSFLILLRIVHIQFSKLPLVLSTEDLFNLAVFCDKYDAVSTVRPVSHLFESFLTRHFLL
jgi:hypothetical protein